MLLLIRILIKYLDLFNILKLRLLSKQIKSLIESSYNEILYKEYGFTSDSPLDTLQNTYLQCLSLSEGKRNYLNNYKNRLLIFKDYTHETDQYFAKIEPQEQCNYGIDKKSFGSLNTNEIKYIVQFKICQSLIELSYISHDNQFKSFLITYSIYLDRNYLYLSIYLIQIEEKDTVLNKYYYQNIMMDRIIGRVYFPINYDINEINTIFKYYNFNFERNEELRSKIVYYKNSDRLFKIFESNNLEFLTTASTITSGIIKKEDKYFEYICSYSYYSIKKYDTLKECFEKMDLNIFYKLF